MKTLKLEIGGKYKSRNGQIVTILEKIRGLPRYPYIGDNNQCYTIHGGQDEDETTIGDLIEEIE